MFSCYIKLNNTVMSKERAYIRVKSKIRQEKLHEQGCQCALCGRVRKPHELQAHHKKQFQYGGSSTDPDNIALVCADGCHAIADADAEKGIPFEVTLRRLGGQVPGRPLLLKPHER